MPDQRSRAIIRAAFTILGCAVAAMPALAGDYASRKVAGWTVAASEDGSGCFQTREYDRTGGTVLLLGLGIDGTNHLSVLNDNWSIKRGERLKLTFRLSKGSYAGHDVVGMAADGKRGFVAGFERAFPAYFAASHALAISRGDIPVERLDLDGSAAALAELRRCVAAVKAMPAATRPRTAKADSIPRDPFARDAKRGSRK